jgi:hypothetical protein
LIRRFCGLSLSLLASLLLVAPASAATFFDYPNFASTAGLTLNGTAVAEGGALRLTPALANQAGSVFATTPVDPQQSWETQFQISMHDFTCCDVRPADGLTFVIQSEGLSGGSGLGGSLGYGDIAPSVAVEFDSFHNDGDPTGNHVAILTEGNVLTHLSCANEGGPSAPCAAGLPFPIYGAPVVGWVEFDAATQHLRVYLSQSATKPATPLLDQQVSLAPIGTSAYAGFTAATGAHNSIHDVLSWRFGRPEPAIVPAPVATPKKKKSHRCGKAKAKGKGKKAGNKKASASKKKGKGKKCRVKKKKNGKGKGKR